MTEAQWRRCADASRMRSFLQERMADRKDARRKIRLLLAAFCRKVWDRFKNQSRKLVEASERYADGEVSFGELKAVWDAHGKAISPRGALTYWAHFAQNASHRDIWQGALGIWAGFSISRWEGGVPKNREQADLYRDVFGNPFRPVALDPALRTPLVISLAQAAYDERILPAGELDPHRLAVLADALEEAGAGEKVVGHLRDKGPHVRGCWAVDLCLGKT